MKILELRLKNLNALYGEWSIDLTDPEYLSNGIFALTGPTGAGKSTILDAICLALYGATPRLGRITQSANEIMSRQTGECYAEVVFESQAGKFLCHWEQRRARKKPDGPLQAPEHQIANAIDGKILETKKSLVLGVIESKTGMDFDRFTRSILLAQGGFDTFLKANAEEKSKILEQITGTAIYSDISRRTHERQRHEKEKLNLLEAQTSTIELLEPEALAALEHAITEKQQAEIALATEAEKTQQAIQWRNGLALLEKELEESTQALIASTEALTAFKSERNKLDDAVRAATLTADYTEVQAASKQIKTDEAALQVSLTEIPALTQAAADQATLLRTAESDITQAKAAQQQAAPTIIKVRSFDQTIAEQEKVLSERKVALAEIQASLDKTVTEQQAALANRQTTDDRMHQLTSFLQTHAEDEQLVGGLSGIESQLSQLATQQSTIQHQQQLLNKTQAAYETAKLASEQAAQVTVDRKQALDHATEQHTQASETLTALLDGKLLREYRAEKDALLREMALNAKIAELEDHRQQLEDGKPCPLCGADEHPFASGNLPKQDETEATITALNTRIETAEAHEIQITTAEKQINDAKQQLLDAENKAATLAQTLLTIETTAQEAQNTIQQLQTTLANDSTTLSASLASLGITDIATQDASEVMDGLRARQQQWLTHVKEKDVIAAEIAQLDNTLTRLNTMIETDEKGLVTQKMALDASMQNIQAIKDKRHSLYGDKNPNTEEQLLNDALIAAEAKAKTARLQADTTNQQLQATQTKIEVAEKNIKDAQAPFEALKKAFITNMQNTGFAQQQDFRDARMQPEAQASLAAKAKMLDDHHTALSAQENDRKTRLSAESQKQVTTEALATLEPIYQNQIETLNGLRDSVASLKQELIKNNEAFASIQGKQAAMTAQKAECARWDNLHALIGSADGKKFRNFAQGLTFELMVSHANQQLEKMTDRYLLIRDTTLPLALNVVDNYQAGEIRSTKNLSGGESFIVSLTLALGLSKMASKNVRIDSLFLDEGFGTLDEDALETALETLSSLHQEGKLIGIISHVGALKERIQTQIAVTPLSAGKSAVTGPGCNKVSSSE